MAVVKRINEVSKLVGVSKRTLQYYDDEGVLAAERSENNHRLYDKKALEKIWRIMLYKEMGFDLSEIKKLQSMSDSVQNEIFKLQIQEDENKINKLKEQIEFIFLILERGMPHMPEEDTGETYMDKLAELRKTCVHNRQGDGENEYDQFERDKEKNDKSDYVKQMRRLRYRLDEAYQQMQQGQFRYAIYDAHTVMKETVKMIVQHTNGSDNIGDNLLDNMKICRRERLFGDHAEFINRLYEVYYICECEMRTFTQGEQMNHGKVSFVIMQMKDLLNFAESILISV